MKLTIAAVGKLKEPAFRQLADEYAKRIGRYASLRERELKDGGELERAAAGADVVVALEVRGDALTSTQFAERLERWSRTGKGNVAFLIGGADGIPAQVSRSASARLSLSTMTLPHRLARVVLLEQIYRGFSILAGEPYARE